MVVHGFHHKIWAQKKNRNHIKTVYVNYAAMHVKNITL
jgi:hypothetical protein